MKKASTEYVITRKGFRVISLARELNITLDTADLIVSTIEEADRRYDARKSK